MLLCLLASLDAMPEANVRADAAPRFAPCPRVHLSDADGEASFWARFDANPRPMILTSDRTVAVDYLKTHGRKLSDEAYQLPDGSVVGSAGGSPYVLTDPAYAPGLFADGLLSKYPLPGVLASTTGASGCGASEGCMPATPERMPVVSAPLVRV